MINVIINGALGHMGRILKSKIEEQEDMRIAALVDAAFDNEDKNSSEYCSLMELHESISDLTSHADTDVNNIDSQSTYNVIIDFSNAAGTADLIKYATDRKIPLLIATTGQNDDQRRMISEAAEIIPIFYSGNMSLGVALLADLVRQAVAAFPTANVEIIETHHVRKVDAPSGTAILLANAAKESRPELLENVGRSGMCKREQNEIGISSVRRGNIVGIHEVIISTDTQSITLKHEAHDRGLFADGAIDAARFLVTQSPGLYDMKSIISK